MPVLGITGGIATGKTLFTGCLARLFPALRLFDADACARRLTNSDPAILNAIRQAFGSAVFDDSGLLQRPILRSIVFADPEKRKTLEAILHPAIRRAWLDLAQTLRQEAANSWLIVDIPLLFETNAHPHLDHSLVVACSAQTQMNRLMDNRHFTPGLAEGMIASQLPLATKVDRGDFVVWNDGSREALESQAHLIAVHLFS